MTAMHQGMKAQPEAGGDRRKFRRISLPLQVRYQLPDGTEGAGSIINISPGGALIEAPDGATYGDELLLYIAKLGRFTGRVTRIERDGFAVSLDERNARIKRIADTLIWLLNGGEESFNQRGAKRIRQDRPAKLLIDGVPSEAIVLDISTTGASIALTRKPPIGSCIVVGRTRATVVRHHSEGIGVNFETALPAKKK